MLWLQSFNEIVKKSYRVNNTKPNYIMHRLDENFYKKISQN